MILNPSLTSTLLRTFHLQRSTGNSARSTQVRPTRVRARAAALPHPKLQYSLSELSSLQHPSQQKTVTRFQLFVCVEFIICLSVKNVRVTDCLSVCPPSAMIRGAPPAPPVGRWAELSALIPPHTLTLKPPAGSTTWARDASAGLTRRSLSVCTRGTDLKKKKEPLVEAVEASVPHQTYQDQTDCVHSICLPFIHHHVCRNYNNVWFHCFGVGIDFCRKPFFVFFFRWIPVEVVMPWMWGCNDGSCFY